MGKKPKNIVSPVKRVSDAEIPVVGPREPCPCGSGRRYKACHGSRRDVFVPRPFEGLPGECDWIAMRELVPAATAPLRIAGDPSRDVVLSTVLPMAWPALVRQDGRVFLGLQVPGNSSDVSRDLGHALSQALTAAPGEPILTSTTPHDAPRLQDLLDLDTPLEVTVHGGFDFWLDGVDGFGPEVQASMEKANAAVVPTVRLSSIDAGYWARIGSKEHLRWALPHDEDTVQNALARLHARGEDTLGEGTAYVGSFRAHGISVPVWDLRPGTEAEEIEAPAAELAARLATALAETSPLTDQERRALSGLRSRQVTLR